MFYIAIKSNFKTQCRRSMIQHKLVDAITEEQLLKTIDKECVSIEILNNIFVGLLMDLWIPIQSMYSIYVKYNFCIHFHYILFLLPPEKMLRVLLSLPTTFLAFDWTFHVTKSIMDRIDCFTSDDIRTAPRRPKHQTEPNLRKLRQRDRSHKLRKEDTISHPKRDKSKHIDATCLVVCQQHEFVLSVVPQPS